MRRLGKNPRKRRSRDVREGLCVCWGVVAGGDLPQRKGISEKFWSRAVRTRTFIIQS